MGSHGAEPGTRREWQLLYESPTGTTISDMDMFAEHCVLYERRHGRPAASIVSLKNDLLEEGEFWPLL